MSDVRVVVEQLYDVVYQHDSSHRRLLHHCGFSYQKVEHVYRSQASEQVRLEFEAELETIWKVKKLPEVEPNAEP